MIFGGSSHHGRPADVDHFEDHRRPAEAWWRRPQRVELQATARWGRNQTTEFSCVDFGENGPAADREWRGGYLLTSNLGVLRHIRNKSDCQSCILTFERFRPLKGVRIRGRKGVELDDTGFVIHAASARGGETADMD